MSSFEDLESRISQLETIVNGLSNALNNLQFYQGSDIKGCIETENNQLIGITQNTADIDYIAMETGVEL